MFMHLGALSRWGACVVLEPAPGWLAHTRFLARPKIRPKIRIMLMIGLMSGTSADAVDAALVRWPTGPAFQPFELLAEIEIPHPSETRERIQSLVDGAVAPGEVLAEQVALDAALGEAFAIAAKTVAESAGMALSEIDGIASHGQTLAHHPERGGTLQIGSPSILAERTGCPVVADFRPRDLALGGEGAPLAPFFHHAVFTDTNETRGVLNLGGIANLTFLPASAAGEDVVAFDVGPANSLLDGVVSLISDGREQMDRGGVRASAGTVHAALLAELLEDEYLQRPPPKSTGRERYGRQACHDLVLRWREIEGSGSTDDLMATLVAFTTEAVGLACRDWTQSGGAPLDRLLVGGGGAHNPAVMDGLRAALSGVPVESFDRYGVPVGAAEAMAFSLLGRNALLGLPNHLPHCTGARRAAVLGVVVPGS